MLLLGGVLLLAHTVPFMMVGGYLLASMPALPIPVEGSAVSAHLLVVVRLSVPPPLQTTILWSHANAMDCGEMCKLHPPPSPDTLLFRRHVCGQR